MTSLRRALLLPFVFIVLVNAGCLQTRYLAQAAGGQWDIMKRARPIDAVLQTGDAPAHVRALLAQVPTIQAWGEKHGLESSRNYRDYADLERPAAVWVVQASAPLRFQAKTWSFPIVGTVPYLGFFNPSEAKAFAEKLGREESLDVEVRTASAYSTLGWLRDPVLSTMISDGPEALGEWVNVLLHESVHATVYIAGQSAFDESLASFVADRMTAQYLDEKLGATAPQTTVWKRFDERSKTRVAWMQQAFGELEALYASAMPDEEKLAEKARIFARLQAQLGTSRRLNNATLVGMKKYGTGTEAFERLYEACGRQWPRFLHALGTLKSSDFPEPQSEAFDPVLDALTSRGC